MALSNSSSDPTWWRQACVYQIYPRSFADGNGDGIGDLIGITSRIPYLKALGMDAVWLSPFFPSPLADGGYDVSDFRDVDPRIGTLDEFDEMMKAFKGANIKVIVDIVPNHSSNEHPWFQSALKSPKGSPERARYHFIDGIGENNSEPPSDWISAFGGSTWEPVGDGQFYFHMCDVSQPDFNWENSDVQEEFIKTFRFWADRGVDGFRIDVASGCAKDLSPPYKKEEELKVLTKQFFTPGVEGLTRNAHPFWDRDEALEIHKEWRKVFNEYDPPLMAVAEAWVGADRKSLYASPEGLGQCFSFDLVMCDYKPDQFRRVIKRTVEDAKASGSSATFVLSNHDFPRHLTRYSLPYNPDETFPNQCAEYFKSRGEHPKPDYVTGLKRARAATLMLLALPGAAYLYQGEELGLPEVANIRDEDRQDPVFHRTKGVAAGRDGCRVPLPWKKEGNNFGFGDGQTAHLPMPDWFGEYSVEVEEADPDSTLSFYRKAIELRRQLRSDDDLQLVDSGPEVIRFRRHGSKWECLFNFDGENVALPEGEILISSGPLLGGRVPKDTAVWLRVG